jgi:SAM-dependent methyltransferase
MPEPVSESRPTLTTCPLCTHHGLTYQFTHASTPIVRCDACGLLMRNPQPSDAELGTIYTDHYFLGSGPAHAGLAEETDRLKRATAAGYLDEIEGRLGVDAARRRGLRLLEVGSGLGNLLVEADSRSYDVTGIEYSESSVRVANEKLGAGRVVQGSLDTVPLADAAFDIAVLADVIEHTRNPLSNLMHVWRLLKPGGVLFVAVPSLDSWSARLMKQRWMEFKLEHLFFFDERTIRSFLFRSGFDEVTVSPGWKTLSPEYVIQHFDRFPVPVLSPAARATRAVVPRALRRQHVNVVASGINVMARRSPQEPPSSRRTVLSVVMPVFNERKTFRQTFDRVHAKQIPNVDLEIIIVESRSTDGTREEVHAVERHPRVRVVYEDTPKGKGRAVRTGLQHATGDFVLIQDADDEYDVDDYDQLVEPLVTGRAAFVLGARHGMDGTTWKMRHFTDQVFVSQVMNFGHLFFTGLFNLVYGQRLRDPFTMFKVFRRDCLYGLTFESNRFDFDWELVGKLVRAGYTPLEIPVNYTSRSFSEGKKVSFWRDPFTYFRACFKYRFVRLRSTKNRKE